jgi:squalene synthase HpnC
MSRTPSDAGAVAPIMDQAESENFPVASALIPRKYREHLLAIYGFCRLVDDLGDESSGDREAALDWAAAELETSFSNTPTHPLFIKLARTIAACVLEREPFLKLIAANRLDQVKSSYATYDELVSYCELSANPVGRLVLGVFGAATATTTALSDKVCTALQIVEHLQDVAEDHHNGRIYLPVEDMVRFGVEPSDLAAPTANSALRRLIAFESSRAQELLDEGSALLGYLGGSARVAVAGFIGGGLAQLDELRALRYDVIGATVKASRAAVASRFFHQYVRARRN